MTAIHRARALSAASVIAFGLLLPAAMALAADASAPQAAASSAIQPVNAQTVPVAATLPAATVQALRASRIVVVGGSGRNGSAIVHALESVGVRPKAMTRDPVKARTKRGDHDWISGDVTQPATLDAAFKGADVVIDAAATTEADGPNGTEAVDREGVRNVATAAKRAGVKRVLLITGMAVANPPPGAPPFMMKVLTAKRESERILAASGVPFVILRPTGILDRPGGAFAVKLVDSAQYHPSPEEFDMRRRPPGEAERAAAPPPGTISLEDLARVAAFAAVDPSAQNRGFVVTQAAAPAHDDWSRQLAAIPAGTF